MMESQLQDSTMLDQAMVYWSDAWQRSILTLEALNERGNIHLAQAAKEVPNVLNFANELILDGRKLPRPANYGLVRIVPPEGAVVDPAKPPIVVVDPRAGHGPGIGGMKPDSEIGVAIRAGHPCYFVGFSPNPMPGQTIEDVCRAEAAFIEEAARRHPEAESKPIVIANCQAGWQTLMTAAIAPDLMGPIVVVGSPLSYWAGVHGKNPMRYLGGMLGGSWLARLTSDLGNGIFDGAWLIANFDAGSPSNTFWGKQYNIWANPEQQEKRYLQFEKWWGDFILLRGEELQYMVDNLFIGNKLSTARIVTGDGIRLDLREIRSPIICFCSEGDNITPPQQALDWILDNYESVDDIRRAGQTILYCLNQKVGHLAIFVGTAVAAKEHAEFMNYMELIDAVPPGLYEIIINQKPEGATPGAGGAGDYDLGIEPRGLEDIRALGSNSLDDEREFAAVARMSEVNNTLYETYVQPWVKAMTSPQVARAVRELHPLRLGYSILSDKNPMMGAIAPMAEQVKAERAVPAPGNMFVSFQEQFSRAMIQALDQYGNTRDRITEQMFHAIYGSPAVQAWCGIPQNGGPPRQRPGQSPSTKAALAAEIRRLGGRFAEGTPLDAAARMVVYIAKSHHRVEARCFDALQRLLAAHPEVTFARFKEALREQWAILAIDERAAIDALPQLLPADAGERRALLDEIKSIVSAASSVDTDVQRRLGEIEQLLGDQIATGKRTPAEHTAAGDKPAAILVPI